MRLINVKNAYEPSGKISKSYEIIEQSKLRISPNINDYVEALERASSKILQNRIPLYDNYLQTLMVDDIVISLIDKRLENVLNKEIKCFTKDGEQVDMINEFLQSPRFADFIKDILMSKFWGFSVFEFSELDWDGIKLFDYFLLPHKHINPYEKQVLKSQYDADGIDFSNADDVMMVGNADDLGLLSKITYLSILNRTSTFAWTNYLDLASNNFLTIKGKGYADDEELERLQLDYMTGDKKGSIYLPEGIEADFENQSSTSQNLLFEGYYDMIRERMSILILGNTLTSTNDGVGSNALGQVHQLEQGKKYTADEIYVENILNYEFKDYLKIWFGDISIENLYFRFIPSTESEINEKINNFKQLKELGILFTDEELRNHFGDLLK